MKCVRCNRPLSVSAVTIHKGRASFFFGPRCAKLAGIELPKVHRILSRRSAAASERETDPRQQDLWGVAA
jgi:hypothetical protein